MLIELATYLDGEFVGQEVHVLSLLDHIADRFGQTMELTDSLLSITSSRGPISEEFIELFDVYRRIKVRLKRLVMVITLLKFSHGLQTPLVKLPFTHSALLLHFPAYHMRFLATGARVALASQISRGVSKIFVDSELLGCQASGARFEDLWEIRHELVDGLVDVNRHAMLHRLSSSFNGFDDSRISIDVLDRFVNNSPLNQGTAEVQVVAAEGIDDFFFGGLIDVVTLKGLLQEVNETQSDGFSACNKRQTASQVLNHEICALEELDVAGLKRKVLQNELFGGY